MEDEVYPMTLLTEELKSDEVETRIKAMRRLRTVAQALGPERTRSDLLPFLREATEDEDEVLVALAEELGGFVDLVGGAEHAAALVEPLEVLAGVEETVVRDRAVESLQKVAAVVPTVGDIMVPLAKRLAEGDWFTSRVSVCSLFAAIYGKLVDAGRKKEMRDFYQLMCNDDTPMVRRAAAANIGKFAATMEKEHVAAMILPLFRALSADDQDSVRLLAIENSAAIAELLSQDENSMHVLPIVRSSVEDRSWRVRFSIAKDFFPLSRAMGTQITESELLGCFSNLLQDAEAEVRAAAAKNLSGYISIIKSELFSSEILPLLSALSQDTAPNVRTAVSIACMELSPKLGEATSKSTLAPLLLLFLRDEVVDVRLNILKRMELLAQWMASFESVLLPAIADLARDLQWRVREAVILSIPALAGSLGGQYFQEHLLEIYVSAFTDMVGEVRLSATKILPQLLESLGSDYILQNVMPRLNQIFDKSVIYQERVNVLHALKQMAVEKVSSDLLTLMTTLAIRGAHDKIPNVRFVASMTLEQLCKFADASVVSAQVRPCLTELVNDSDMDVKYYSSIALDAVQG
ncbi:Protein phosphatase 2A scaffold subunit [Phytophthora fragariae]|uniref:Protein phosphatase 2A scaffold subunit n=1 Tax=Phytophthora fragariae TaxID=53985 RepID=A0A6A3ZU36_9STRA|nr:Protein phosphatase 2A scaffold subunit [Phytophthora fragariae]KAE8941209.1 Protein phosphatase 2A scaffold subunit [Phytophthora fragariae]KAE9016473.1 Protein phosphatase 2A scaffold subunit [Phytophthora fragariae]KAE9089215.1 Protein phosphatase 2A scaffold subunit [Phytophthora fragariae]KAE9118931.1 Protein phosphatase 2A scaffold subunit [Phytophthora fragariae]